MKDKFVITGDAMGIIPVKGAKKPVTVMATEKLFQEMDDKAVEQICTVAAAPGVNRTVLNPDAHVGYGSPIGSVLVSDSHIYPGPVGLDMNCSMSLLQFETDPIAIRDKPVRRKLIEAICDRIPTGMGKGASHVSKGRTFEDAAYWNVLIKGARPNILESLGIPKHWWRACEDAWHGNPDTLEERLLYLQKKGVYLNGKYRQLGSYGGGNHFGECNVVSVVPGMEKIAESFLLEDGKLCFLSHCGSRGLGHTLAQRQFRGLKTDFEKWSIPFPGDDYQNVYAPLGTWQADQYISDMQIAANWATVNHMLINALVAEAWLELFPGANPELIYFISHNNAKEEIVDNRKQWVMRKGATRAFPAGHHALKDTAFSETGHPILLPGDPVKGSSVMVALEGAHKTCHSINHGAGRAKGRRAADREFDQGEVNQCMDDFDILSNMRDYPKDEAPKAYKAFHEVKDCVEEAGVATEVAKLRAHGCFVIKDGGPADD